MSFTSCEPKQQQQHQQQQKQQTFQRVSPRDETSLKIRFPHIIKSNEKTNDVSTSSKDNRPWYNYIALDDIFTDNTCFDTSCL